MSSSEMNAAISIRKSPNSSGDAPGLRFTWLVTRAFGHAFVHRFDRRDLFQHAVCFGECSSAGFTPIIAAPSHFPRIETEQDLMEVVSITARERPSQHHNPVDTVGKRSECIALSSIAG